MTTSSKGSFLAGPPANGSGEAAITAPETAIERRESEVGAWLDGMPFVETLGMSVASAREGRAVVHLQLRQETSFSPEGGFPAATIGALIDVCAGAAVASQLPSGHVVATADVSMKMLASIPGPVATATATALRVGRGSATASVEVRSGLDDGPPCAVGLVTLQPRAVQRGDREHRG